MAKVLTTVDDVIKELGGNKVVAELTGRKWDSAISNWKDRKAFPPNTYAIINSELAKRGLAAPDSLWGMERASA